MNAGFNSTAMTITGLTALIIATMLAPASVNAHCAGKHSGNHPHCAGEDPPPDPDPGPDPGPSGCPGDFPALAYAEERTNKRGMTVGSDLKVANADGSCAVLIHSVSTSQTYDDLTFNFDGGSGFYRIAYNYETDEADTRDTGSRPNVRLMEFTVSEDAGTTTIDQDLPLQAHEVYRYSGNSTAGRGILGTDLIGGSLVFSEEHGFEVGTKGNPQIEWFDSVKVIEDVSDCIATYGPEPDDHCAVTVFEHSVNLSAFHAKWGLDNNRILFTYDSSSPRDSNRALAMIDRAGPGSPWSDPGLVRRHSDDGGEPDATFPALWDYGVGPRTVLPTMLNGELRILYLEDSCTAANAQVDSCLAQGLAGTVAIYPSQTRLGYLTMHTTIDAGPNLLFYDRDTASLREFDLDSQTQAQIIGNVPRLTSFAPLKD